MVVKITKLTTFAYIKKVFMLTGNTIEIEKGIYKIPETLYFNSNNIINGNGSTFQMGGKIHNILMSYTTPNTTGYNGVHDVIFNDLIVEQMYSKYGACKCNGITCWHTKNITFNNVKAFDTIFFHGTELNSAYNTTFNNCEFSGYIKDVKNDFRESSQIDFSSESAIFIHKSGSKCYDNCPCKNITYSDCTFRSHGSRKAPTICIGNHCQGANVFHENIAIRRCKFYGDATNTSGYAIRLIGMKHVIIEDCYSENYSRFVLITNMDYSYDKRGKKIKAKDTDGLCDDVLIQNNIIKPLKTYNVVDVFEKTNTGSKHTGIVKKNNKIIK